jgi:hypothetical protein
MRQAFYWPGHPLFSGPNQTPILTAAMQLPPQLPDHVIVDASEFVKPFQLCVRSVPAGTAYLFDNTDLLNSILQSICYEENAEISLEYDIMEKMRHVVGTTWDQYIDILAQGMIEFGYNLLNWFREQGLYVNGWLPYQYGRWLGVDIILQKVMAPDLNECTPMSEALRNWIFTPAGPYEHHPEGDLILPNGFTRDPSGVYAYPEEDPSPGGFFG